MSKYFGQRACWFCDKKIYTKGKIFVTFEKAGEVEACYSCAKIKGYLK